MRVIDFGRVPALRSQSLWHALGASVRAGDPPTLSFVRPDRPYVCLGYHRDVAEVDTAWCGARGLPVLRRLVGGGPVYLDADQLFFQICLPAQAVRSSRVRALARLLTPAVQALREVGFDARLDAFGEITVGEAKVCGHGAGQVGDGVLVVGNLITAFDHARAARVLDLDAETRREVERLMRRHVAATPVDVTRWRAAMVRAYAAHFGAEPCAAAPGDDHRRALARMDALLGRPDFVAGEPRPPRTVRTVKVRAGVWVHRTVTGDGERTLVAVARGRVETARGRLVAHLAGLPVEQARHALDEDGAEGTAALAAALRAANTEVAAA